jgi:hypothetical protein
MEHLVCVQRNRKPQVRCDIRTSVCVYGTCYFIRRSTEACPVTVCVAVEASCLRTVALVSGWAPDTNTGLFPSEQRLPTAG